jgi:surface antigen
MFRTSKIIFLATCFALASCQSDNRGPDQTVGTLGGPAAGGVVSNQLAKGNGKLVTTGLGVLLGSWAGNEIVTSMDTNDRQKNGQAENRAFSAQIGQQVTWKNPDSGHSGTIVPVSDGFAATGAYCRNFQQTILIGSQPQQGFVKTCQQRDGSWKIVP